MKELKIEYIDISKLTHYANNSKIHTKEQIRHIANSIEEFGFNDPLGIAGEDNIILEGNGRVEAAKLLDMKTIPCIRLDHLTKEEQQAYVIAHNAVNLETSLDDGILLDELKKLQNYDFANFGLKELELEKMTNIDDEYYRQLLYSQTKQLVRNEFCTIGKYDIPIIINQNINLDKIKLFSYSNTKYEDSKNKNRTIHFFLHDYRFENVYSNADIAVEKLKQYYALCSPDYSLYIDMPILLQMYNTFKNRWCGAYWQSLGLNVIPTLSWSDERSYEFCFDGVETGSIVAVSTHGNHKSKEMFINGYNEMLKKIKPYAIICYGKPFKEMQGNIKIFPYNRHENSEAKYGI